MADWSQLLIDLLQLISQKLNSEFYLLRFRSVCSAWRSSIPNYRPNRHLPFKLPPIPGDDGICYVVKHNIFLIKPSTIPHQQHQQILQPRLIRIGPNVNGSKTHLWDPLDLTQRLPFHFPHKVVFDFNHITIVDLGHVFLSYMLKDTDTLQNSPYPYVYRVVVATCPGELQPHIVTLDKKIGEPWMIRPGDDGWVKIPNVSSCSFGDICNFKGRTCVVDEKGRTVMIGLDLSVDLVADERLDLDWGRLCLVDSELVLVDNSACVHGIRIDVYRLDEKKKKWVILSNLGDGVLFVGKLCSFSASAFDLGFANGNCVIDMNDNDAMNCGISDLNFDEVHLLPLSDYPDYYNLLADSGVDHEKLQWEK